MSHGVHGHRRGQAPLSDIRNSPIASPNALRDAPSAQLTGSTMISRLMGHRSTSRISPPSAPTLGMLVLTLRRGISPAAAGIDELSRYRASAHSSKFHSWSMPTVTEWGGGLQAPTGLCHATPGAAEVSGSGRDARSGGSSGCADASEPSAKQD